MLSEKLGDLTLLEVDLRAMLAQNPNSTLALNALGYTLANRTERLQEAKELISKALALQPEDPAILDSMGWVHYRLGNHKIALGHLKKALSLFADHEIAAHLGEVLWILGQQEQAKAVWQAGLEKDPQSKILEEVIQRFDANLSVPSEQINTTQTDEQ